MTLALPDDKRVNINRMINDFKNRKTCKIREWARFIGSLMACCPALKYSWVYVKRLERLKLTSLEANNDSYNAQMVITEVKSDLDWWSNNIFIGNNTISRLPHVIEIFSDASLTGWGAYCNNERANGFWTIDGKNNHINFLELKAAYFGLQCFAKTLKNCNILLRIDNTTAIAYLNKMGGAQHTHLNDITREIWQWCERRNIVIFASYIASKENVEADEESRRLEPETEFSLSDYAFRKVIKNFGIPDIDLFASHSNKKCERFISWKKDPEAETVDAFTISWKGLFVYAFPPLSILLKVLRKIKIDAAEGIVIVPDWPGQPWFPLFKKMLVKEPIKFKPNKNLIMFSNRHHPMWRSITLVAGQLSGRL
ncbi:uncharacterized protein LOC106655901 [Trichogramma pretiosum]|uniref:uncharacterized protein LOC106655901 n=1 Tax=Trichogramma pretiosum TaxID=7493 RepID=UPI000C71A592|nr:uncharacterized protein LOC106655901 [Trichogramma pretiosum]